MRAGPVGGPPREVAQLGQDADRPDRCRSVQDSAALPKTGAVLTEKTCRLSHNSAPYRFPVSQYPIRLAMFTMWSPSRSSERAIRLIFRLELKLRGSSKMRVRLERCSCS